MNLEWGLRAKTSEYKRRLSYAISAIHKAQESHSMAVSWSAGKDSTALTHLIKTLYPETPVIIQFDDCDWPEKLPYAKRIISNHEWENVHFVTPSFSVLDVIKQGGIGKEDYCSQKHPLTKDAFIKPLKNKQKELCCDGIYLGLRAEESKARRADLNSRHELYHKPNGELRCCPLARWSVYDIFAYLQCNDVEINPCYFNNRFFSPENIRLSWAIPTPTNISRGESEHLRFYYPQQFARLRDTGIF